MNKVAWFWINTGAVAAVSAALFFSHGFGTLQTPSAFSFLEPGQGSQTAGSTSGSTGASSGEFREERTPRTFEDNILFQQMSLQEQEDYRTLREGILSHAETINLPTALDAEQVDRLLRFALYQDPELVETGRDLADWVTQGIAGKVSSITPGYVLNQEQADTVREQMAEIRRDIASETASLSAYDTEKYIVDYLADNITYSEGHTDAEKKASHTVEAALLEGRSVCEGYSLAMKYLLDGAGIDSFTIVGQATDSGDPVLDADQNSQTSDDAGSESDDGSAADENKMVGHIWNAVRMEDGWYYTDPTYDDSDNRDTPLASRGLYFNLPFDDIMVNRTDEEMITYFPDYPKENNTGYTLFAVNNSDISSLSDFEKLVSEAAEAGKDTVLTVRFANDSLKQQAEQAYTDLLLTHGGTNIDWSKTGTMSKEGSLVEQFLVTFQNTAQGANP